MNIFALPFFLRKIQDDKYYNYLYVLQKKKKKKMNGSREELKVLKPYNN